MDLVKIVETKEHKVIRFDSNNTLDLVLRFLMKPVYKYAKRTLVVTRNNKINIQPY